jgi:hypothetical protein
MTTAPATLPIFEERRQLDRRQSDAERALAAKEVVLEAARYLRCRKQFDAATMLLDEWRAILARVQS